MQSNFYRQIRNLRIDISDVKADNASCIHWQVGQATSIENVNCIMSNDGSTTQRGICRSHPLQVPDPKANHQISR